MRFTITLSMCFLSSHGALRLLPDRLAVDAMAASLRNSPLASETTTDEGRVLSPTAYSSCINVYICINMSETPVRGLLAGSRRVSVNVCWPVKDGDSYPAGLGAPVLI